MSDDLKKICDHLSKCSDFGNCCAIEQYFKPVESLCLGFCKVRQLKGEKVSTVQVTVSENKLTSYARAEAYNATHGEAAQEEIDKRIAACAKCPYRKTEYQGMKDEFGWCSQCGCGASARALLKTKARMAQVRCPLTPPKWDKVSGVGGSLSSVMDSVKGVGQSIKHLLTGNKDTPPPVS